MGQQLESSQFVINGLKLCINLYPNGRHDLPLHCTINDTVLMFVLLMLLLLMLLFLMLLFLMLLFLMLLLLMLLLLMPLLLMQCPQHGLL